MPQVVDYDDQDLLAAARSMLLHGDGMPLVPYTALTTDSAQHARTLTVDDPTQLTSGGLLQFEDGTGEPDTAISADWDGSNPVRLYFPPNQNGLLYAHTHGADLATNLFVNVPNNIDGMLTGENCVIYLTSPDNRSYRMAQRQDEGQYTIHIDYLRRMAQPDLDMDANAWAMQQQAIAHRHMHIIKRLFLGNPKMITENGQHVLDSGDPMNATRERFLTSFRQIIVSGIGNKAVVDYGATGEYSVRGLRTTIPYRG